MGVITNSENNCNADAANNFIQIMTPEEQKAWENCKYILISTNQTATPFLKSDNYKP